MLSDRQLTADIPKTISREQVLRFIEHRLALADHDHDGVLDQNELALFAYSIVCSFRKAKAQQARSFSESLLNDPSVL